MALEHIVLQRLSRSEYNGPIEVKSRSEENAVDGVAYSIFEQAKQQFNRSASKRFGFFDAEAENKQLIGLINNWQAEQINFASFSAKALLCLQQLLDFSETPFNATLLFAHETLLGQHYLYCLWLPMAEVILTGDDLEPYRTEAVEAHKVHYGLRLHLDAWKDEDSPKYLTQIASRGSKDLAEAFTGFSNFKEGVDLGEQTKEFLQIIEEYADEMPEDEGRQMKTLVLDYCVERDKVGSPVLLDEISEQISDEKPQQFAEFVTAKQHNPDKEIYTDRASLKRYMRYFGRDTSMSISFSAERFGKDITYDPASGSLRIHQLPKSLKVQLSGHHDKTE